MTLKLTEQDTRQNINSDPSFLKIYTNIHIWKGKCNATVVFFLYIFP